MTCGCERDGDKWMCAGKPSSECDAIAAAEGKVRRFGPGEREVEMQYLHATTLAAKRKRAQRAANRRWKPPVDAAEGDAA